MKSTSRVLGIIGLVCIAFGLGVGLYTASFKQAYVMANLGLGTVFVLIAAIVNAGDLKEGLTGRSSKAGANALIYATAVLAILVLINFISNRHDKRFDLTENKQFSLAEATIGLVKGLDKEVKVTGFFLGGKAGPIEDVLNSYRHVNRDKFSWEVVDPDKRPELAERYSIRANGTLIIESGNERKTLTEANPQTLEENLTNALLSITGTGKKIVCAIEGHGERDVADEQSENGFAMARKSLEGENYEVKPVLLASMPAVPQECTIVMIAGPQKPFLDGEVQSLDAYLSKGGSLYAMVEPGYEGGLIGLLKKWGVDVRNDLVVDKVVRLFEGEQLGVQPIVTVYDAEHPIVREFKKQTIFTQARSVGKGQAPEGYGVTEIAKTSANSWGETKIEQLFKSGQVAMENDDKPGPLAVMVAVGPTGTEREGKAKIVVVGDADFAGNRFIRTFFNGDLFLNVANWLTNQEKQISIRPKGPRSSFVRLTDEQMGAIFLLAVLLFPQMLLTVGILIGWRRRS